MDLNPGNYDTLQFVAELKRLGIVAFQGHGISLNFQAEMNFIRQELPKPKIDEDDLLFASSSSND